MKMASNFPVDENNLSFSDDDASSLFITQSTFRDINTQEVSDAVEFFDNITGDMSCGDNSNVQKDDLADITIPEDWRDHKSVHYFDFSNDIDNGYDVSSQEPYVLTRHYDGKKFVVGDSSSCEIDKADDSTVDGNVRQAVPYDVERISGDLKCFGDAIKDEELEAVRHKR